MFIVSNNVSAKHSAYCLDASVSIYDGSSSTQPLMGTYCGNSIGSSVCQTGQCRNISNPIFTTSSSFVVVAQYGGTSVGVSKFKLKWALVRNPGAKFGLPGLLPQFDIFSSLTLGGFAVGAGIVVTAAKVYLLDASISSNQIVHPIAGAVGGAVSSFLNIFFASESRLSHFRLSSMRAP